MEFRQLFDPVSCTYTYLLYTSAGKEAILIDPVRERMDQYIRILDELDLRLVVAMDTHVHADHITAIGPLSQKTSCTSMMGERSRAELVDAKYKDGEKIRVTGIEIEAMYTPGHTDDSYSLRLKDRVFTGDALLIRGTGRTDFQNGNAEQSYDSIFNRLLKLPDETLVYPAHDYKGEMVSTIGEERQFNPRLQVDSAAEYAEIMNNLNLANPKMMDVAVPANLLAGLTD